MTLKRMIELLKQYFRMNNIIQLADTAGLSSLEHVNNYRLN